MVASVKTVRVGIIGAGISGLATAHYLIQESLEQNLEIEVTILERSDRLGGVDLYLKIGWTLTLQGKTEGELGATVAKTRKFVTVVQLTVALCDCPLCRLVYRRGHPPGFDVRAAQLWSDLERGSSTGSGPLSRFREVALRSADSGNT